LKNSTLIDRIKNLIIYKCHIFYNYDATGRHMPGKVAIVQSAYIPWKGLFDMINMVDTFIFFDSVQFTKRSWINRNRIKSPFGDRWITVPVHGSTTKKIDEVEIKNQEWEKSHFDSLKQSYIKSPYWKDVESIIEPIYGENLRYISEVNQTFIKSISSYLGIKTDFLNSSDIDQKGKKSERLISIMENIGADSYLSGPAAKNYIGDEFTQAGIDLQWMDYSGYPVYSQPHGDFRHDVTVLDLIASCGHDTPSHIWGWRS